MIWVDAHLSPDLATWIERELKHPARDLRSMQLRDATDRQIFEEVRKAGAVIMSKDEDFVRMIQQRGTPPQLIWLTCGNTSNEHLQKILRATFSQIMQLLEKGEEIVEVSDPWKTS